jgi:hypothetical protein
MRLRDWGIRKVAPWASVSALALGAVLLAQPAPARTPVWAGARGGLDLAAAAAHAWAADAELIYVENDEDVDAQGAAGRWGYLFHSKSLDRSRGYSIRDGRILVAENLELKFDAPVLARDWVDSGAALAAADRDAGDRFRREHDGRLHTMLLVRGAFLDEDPDRTTWAIVYTSETAPSLFVVVDAQDGRVRRTWRG